MKVERVNEVQIKFILTKTDLEKRSLDITDLAYGSAKTQELFQDIIETASREFSFNLEDTPLMIEAVPMSKNSITIMLTKVSEDGKSAKLAKEKIMKKIDELCGDEERVKLTREDLEIGKNKVKSRKNLTRKTARKAFGDICCVYRFNDLDQIEETAKIMGKVNSASSIYKYKGEYMFVLELEKEKEEKMQTYNRLLSEHGTRVSGNNKLVKAFLKEQGEMIIERNAVQIMANL